MPLKSIHIGVTVVTSGMNLAQVLLEVVFYYRHDFSTEITIYKQ